MLTQGMRRTMIIVCLIRSVAHGGSLDILTELMFFLIDVFNVGVDTGSGKIKKFKISKI